MRGEITVAEVAQVRQADDFALPVFEFARALAQGPGLFTGQRHVHWVGSAIGVGAGHFVVDGLAHVSALGVAPAQ